MKSFGRIAMLVYGIGIFLGGTMGYVSKKSLASLAAGIASLALMGTAFYLAKTKPKVGYAIGTATAAGLALWAATSQRPKDAEEGFKQLIATYPDEPGVHFAVGLYLMDSDQHAALGEFQKETRANATHWPALLVSAFLETREGQPDLAILAAQQARKLAPSTYLWLCYAEEGRALLAKDEAAKAVPMFEESAKLQPENAQAHFYLEQAYRRAGRKAEAQREKAEFTRLKLQQDPQSMPGIANSLSK